MRGVLASNAAAKACTEAMTSVPQIVSYAVVEKGLEHKRANEHFGESIGNATDGW